jgi:hypothetical protein
VKLLLDVIFLYVNVDRTREEKGLEPLNKNKFRIPKSRYDSVGQIIRLSNTFPSSILRENVEMVLRDELTVVLDCYLSSYSQSWPGYNDTQVNLSFSSTHYRIDEYDT